MKGLIINSKRYCARRTFVKTRLILATAAILGIAITFSSNASTPSAPRPAVHASLCCFPPPTCNPGDPSCTPGQDGN